ncbi:AraC family transcriptional regulator, partial [Klebsiella quasipneumoniae]
FIQQSPIAHSVGYQSHTQFSREYARHFGLSPSSDLKNILLTKNA